MQIKRKVWRLHNKDKHITQLAMENDRKFDIPPACFGQADPSSGETCKIQNRNCLKIGIKTIENALFKRSVTLTFSRLMTYIYIYICLTEPLTSRCCILHIYSTNIRTEYVKHAAHSPFFPLQNAVYFIMLPFLVPVLFAF